MHETGMQKLHIVESIHFNDHFNDLFFSNKGLTLQPSHACTP